jgi:hypothetical protein
MSLLRSLPVLLLLLIACSNKQAVETATVVGNAYNARYRDTVITNWQHRIKDTPECATFRQQMLTEGQRHSSAATGAFANSMMRIRKSAADASCTAK